MGHQLCCASLTGGRLNLRLSQFICFALKASAADKKEFKSCLEMAHKFLKITQVC